MARIEISVQIAAPAEVVFAFFVPRSAYALLVWRGHAGVFGSAGRRFPDFALAQKVRVTGHLGRREVSHTAVVTALQEARLFEWRFSDRYPVSRDRNAGSWNKSANLRPGKRRKRLCACAATTRCPAFSWAKRWTGS